MFTQKEMTAQVRSAETRLYFQLTNTEYGEPIHTGLWYVIDSVLYTC